MQVFIDGDGCPVIDLAISICFKNKIECTIICDTSHVIERDNIRTVTVSKGKDSADFVLVNMLSKNDICITQDYGLAAMCLARGAYAISQNGLIFDEYNINSLLESRYRAQKIRKSGGRLKGPSKRTAIQNNLFSDSFQNLIDSIK